MAQLSLYLEPPVMDALRTDAHRAGLSLSKYTAQIIKQHAQGGMWPPRYWESVYGALDDDTFDADDDMSGLDSTLDDSCDWLE